MTLYYLDPNAPTNGSGSINNPLNTSCGLSLSYNDVLLIKSNSVLTEVLQYCMNNIGITIGYYGTGNAPVLKGSIIYNKSKAIYLSTYGVYALAFQFNGTVQTPASIITGTIKDTSSTTIPVPIESITYIPKEDRTTSYSNQLGNVSQDDIMLTFVPWAGNVFDTINTTPNPAHTRSTKKLSSPGTFSIDYTNNILYINPLPGFLGSEIEVSVKPFAITTAWPHPTLARKLSIDGLMLERQSRHGISIAYRKECVISNIDMYGIGGAWDGGSVYYGNGVELTYGCDDSYINNISGYNIFDTTATVQLYDVVGSSIRRQDWSNITSKNAGLAAFELSLQNGKSTGNSYYGCGVIEHVNVFNLNVNNESDYWSRGRGGTGYLMINNSGPGSRIHNNKLFGMNAISSGEGSVINSQRTSGINGFTNIDASGFVYGITSSISTNPQTDILSKCDFNGAPNNFLSSPTVQNAIQLLR